MKFEVNSKRQGVNETKREGVFVVGGAVLQAQMSCNGKTEVSVRLKVRREV